jgi:hypothetical protein
MSLTKPGLERELELERRKNREHHEQLREKDKEYAKLKVNVLRCVQSQVTNLVGSRASTNT